MSALRLSATDLLNPDSDIPMMMIRILSKPKISNKMALNTNSNINLTQGTSRCCYREVLITPVCSPKWKALNVNTGGSASTLQDIKVAECSGGYGYKDSGQAGGVTRNRFIYWRTYDDFLELVEESLDFNLYGNHVRYHFQDTPILGGVTIHEYHGNIIILVATVSSVHRLLFQHPQKMHGSDLGYMSTDSSLQSIFSDASLSSASDSKNYHRLTMAASNVPQQVHTAATWLSQDGEAMFAYATATGSVLLVKMPRFGVPGVVVQHEMARSSVMQRLWSGIIRGSQENPEMPMSLCLHGLSQDVYIWSICKDHKLRMWSAKTQDCVLVADILDYLPVNIRVQKVSPGPTGHKVKVTLDSDTNTVRLAIYMNFTDQSQFVIVELMKINNRLQLTHLYTLHTRNESLLDCAATADYLWSLWRDKAGDMLIRAAALPWTENSQPDNDVTVVLEPPYPDVPLVPATKDPRESFITEIFQPGRFSNQDILKALNVYRKTHRSAEDLDITRGSLKEQVSLAVETEVKSVASDCEIPEEEYCKLQLEQWAKFYSCCVQYNEVANEVKGIFADNITGMVGVIRKNSISYVRPCDLLEQLVYVPMNICVPSDLAQFPMLNEDQELCHDLINLFECTRVINASLTDDMCAMFEQQILENQTPERVAEQLLNELISPHSRSRSRNVFEDVELALQGVADLPQTIHTVLTLLNLTRSSWDDVAMNDSVDASRQLSCSRLFASKTASSIVMACMGQMIKTRLSLCRDLLLLQMAALQLGDQAGISADVSEKLETDHIPHTSTLLRSYNLLNWISTLTVIPAQQSTFEFSLRQLAALDISENSALGTPLKSGDQNMLSVVLFYHGAGGKQCRSLLTQSTTAFIDDNNFSTWTNALQLVTAYLAQILWPISVNFIFPEFLVAQCQYLHIQQYVWLLGNWCVWNISSRKFLLGQCYLNFNEPYKAADCFREAKFGLETDDFLHDRLLRRHATNNEDNIDVQYYLKVISLFEQFDLPDLIVSLAHTAISIAPTNHPSIPSLWSKVFKCHLDLGHNDQAYAAMVANPDISRRHDCLRQFLVILCERGELEALVRFPYIDLHDQLVSVLEVRARSVDIATHNYYDVLYSFHIFRGNFRKAATIMYEYSLRLGQELPSMKGLQRQAKCLLATLNCLRLANPDYAWIVKPVLGKQLEDKNLESVSPKRMFDGEEKDSFSDDYRKVDLLELSDLQREYLLVSARLTLIQKTPELNASTGPLCSAGETVSLLLNIGLFDQAISVCEAFSLSLRPVFEGLAMRCVLLAQNSSYHMQGDNDYTAQAWQWLSENETGPSYVAKEAASASDQAWLLLQSYLDKYETGPCLYHVCVACKLLSHGFPLPSWFIASYKQLNAAELLRVYLQFDLLEEACAVVLEYVDAVKDTTRGQDREMLNLKGMLSAAPQSVWLPYTYIDQLVLALKDSQTDPDYAKLGDDLVQKVSDYHTHISSLKQYGVH